MVPNEYDRKTYDINKYMCTYMYVYVYIFPVDTANILPTSPSLAKNGHKNVYVYNEYLWNEKVKSLT
jgi:hypothetical protein